MVARCSIWQATIRSGLRRAKSFHYPHVRRASSSSTHFSKLHGAFAERDSPSLADKGLNIQEWCEDFLAVCRTSGGEGSIELDLTKQSIAEIKINNPAKKNALSGKMMMELEKVVTELEKWDVGKGVIIYGQGDSFCSGGDLEFVKKIASPELGGQMSLFMQHTLHRFTNLPLISTAFVRGPAHGGGAELTTAVDYRIFGHTAEVRFVQAKMAITTGWGGATRLAKILGPKAALEYLVSCRRMNFKTAKFVKYCELIVNDNDGLNMTREWMLDFLERAPPNIIKNYRKIVSSASLSDTPFEVAYDQERELFIQTWGNEKHMAAIDAVYEEKARIAQQKIAYQQEQEARKSKENDKKINSTESDQSSAAT